VATKYPKLAGDDGKNFDIVIDKFGKGTMTLYDETRLPKDSVQTAQNMYLDQDGVWTTRPGTGDYGATLTTPVDGAGSFTKYNSSGTISTYIWVVDNGAFKISQDGGSWTTISGKTWTTGYNIYAKQIGSKLYIGNGQDSMAYYDITLGTLVTFSALSTPSSLVAPTRTGLTAGSYNAYYKITAVNTIGETIASAEISVAGGINKTRDNWITATDYLSMSWGSVAGALRYNIYYSDATGAEVYLDSSATNAYIDTGVATPNPYQEAPTVDSTGGPKYAYLALSGNRLWGTRDPNQPYRVGWTGTGQYLGAFNPFYGGGYIDLNKGGNERPEVVAHFRDGRGNAVATVFTSDPNGAGSTWHIALTTLTVDTLVIVIPQAYQQQGSVGTRSPRGVVETNDSIYSPSPKGFRSTGSRQSIINVLVTSDISDAIRPSVRSISNAYSDKIAGYAYDGRIYWSVPVGSTTNNQTWVMDIERNGAWSLHWSVGVKQFFEYTDSTGNIRLLAVPVTGTKLIEFTNGVAGDSGSAFSTNLESGLIHWSDNHVGWAYIQKVYVEIADPGGTINFNVSGTQKGKSFRSLGSISITDSTSESGFGADLYADVLYGDSNEDPDTFSQSSVKKYVRINKMLNNLKYQFTSNTTDAHYTVMQVIIKGVLLPTSDPSEYRA
jgi:hypothetical protein